MSYDQVAVDVLPALAERDQVGRVELERRAQVEGHLVMDVEFLVTVAKSAPGLEL